MYNVHLYTVVANTKAIFNSLYCVFAYKRKKLNNKQTFSVQYFSFLFPFKLKRKVLKMQ